MPLVPFDTLPDDARAWVFAADRPLGDAEAARLLAEVDRWLAQWRAHGEPLTVGRALTANRFLTIAVDQRTTGASGCSIDGLFRALKSLEPSIGASLVGAGLVHWRDAEGTIHSVDRGDFSSLATAGRIGSDTVVFDPSVTTLGEWRERFETVAGRSWHAALL